ncbi:MAG: hypothetical protein ABIS01_14440 [Ferruginibacter sp.]
MKAATINEIKQELNATAPVKLLDLCIRLAKYKKENKELLSYLLFEADDEAAYIATVKIEIDQQFTEINQSNLYFVKKSLRKILRTTAKYIRQTGSRQVEVELLLYFCNVLINSDIPFRRNTVLTNLYQYQLKKIAKVISTLHEDLQYDYLKEFRKLE